MLKIPYDCPRGNSDCIALSNMVSDDATSFFCCGENNGDNREIKQDKYTVCFKGPHRDDISHNDKRDLIHNSAVLIRALAVVEKEQKESRDWSPWKDLKQ